MMRKGFTLIELMIVVAIIAVIAAIAIPNLMQSRIASNESAAIASCRAYLAAQNTFHRTDFYEAGRLQYASGNAEDDAGAAVANAGYWDMYAVDYGAAGVAPVAGEEIRLIDKLFTDAAIFGMATWPGAGPKAGYNYGDLTGQEAETAYEPAIECGLLATPNRYNRSGRNMFVIDVTGSVYQADCGRAALLGTAATTGDVVGTDYTARTTYPTDADLTLWIPVGSD